MMAQINIVNDYSGSDAEYRSLARQVASLNDCLLSGQASSCSFTRRKIRSNIDSARSLLHQLEYDFNAGKTNLISRTSAHSILNYGKSQLKYLLSQLNEIDQNSIDEVDQYELNESSPPPEYCKVSSSVIDTVTANDPSQTFPLPDNTIESNSSNSNVKPKSKEGQFPSSEFRSRKPRPPSNFSSNSAYSSGIAYSTSQAHQINSPNTTDLSSNTMNSAHQENELSNQRSLQLTLQDLILKATRELRESQLSMAQAIEADASIVASASEALNSSASKLELAERRIGVLRRMSEGKGWWGRMILYAWIFALWIISILLVFVGPKLRF